MRIHFIAIGGAAMHNLAIALQEKDFEVSGSDDEIFEPSLSRLKEYELVPKEFGWFPDKINSEIDLVILGMHARQDNPELLKAQKEGIEINSYPEFIYNQCKNKTRVVIAGSHGKTTTTSMILHVMKKLHREFDYMVGAHIRGFDNMVKLTEAPVVILEGDEYFSSPIDMKAKFLWYQPHLSVITGIAWDHINVYPTKELYEKSFVDFLESMEENGKVFYFEGDKALKSLTQNARSDLNIKPYSTIDHQIIDHTTNLSLNGDLIPISVFGNHNLQNLQAAMMICNQLGIDENVFVESIADFEGAANRLELLAENGEIKIFKDFAHSPSKLQATVSACKNQFNDEKLLAVMELHTFSSLNPEYLQEYKDCMNDADTSIVFYSPETLKHKQLKEISSEEVSQAFGTKNLQVITDKNELRSSIVKYSSDHKIVLLMSSGKFSGIDLKDLSDELISDF